jgi:DNA-binding NarL/FixJ family response regulator
MPIVPAAGKIRLLLIDDHPLLRAGLANLLEMEPDLLVVGQARTGEEGLEVVRRCRPDVCLLDLSLPGIDGFETLRRLRHDLPTVRVIVLTSSDSAVDAARALREGACGYLSKNVERSVMVSTVRAVHRGEKGIQQGVTTRRAGATSCGLTPRELEVLSLVRKGLTNAEIGEQMHITERTVKGHVTGILEKLGAHDRAGAVARGFDLGLLKASGAAGP